MAEGRVVKNTAYLISAFVGQKLLSFLYFTIVARHVGVESSGRYFVAVSFTTIFSVFIDLGMSNVLVREVAKHKEKAQGLLASALGLKAVLAALTVVAALTTAKIFNYPEETGRMIAIACGVMVLDSVHLAFYAVMRGLQNLRHEAIGVVGGQLITILSGIAFILSGLPLPFLVVALLLGSTWNVLWAAGVLARVYGIYPRPKIDPDLTRFLFRVTLPFALAGIFSRVYSYIDSIMLSKLVSDASVGIYGVAYKIAFAFQFIPMAFSAAIYPAMSEYYVSNRARLAAVFEMAETYLLLAVIPLAVGLSTVAVPVIRAVYGPDFLPAVPPLRILMASLVFAFLYWPAGSLLNACHREAKNTAVMGLTMGLNIVLNVLLIPRYSEIGAAVAALFGNFALFAGAFWFARHAAPLAGAKLLWTGLRILGCAAVMAAAIIAAMGKIHIAILVPAGAAVYLLALVATKTVTASELTKVASMFLRRGRGVSDIAV